MEDFFRKWARLVDPIAEKVAGRWRSSWSDALASSVAAIFAWLLARHMFGHLHPVFAAVSAIVCLSPGLPSHAKQAVGLMLGVATGIAVGELCLFLPDGAPLIRISVATFFAIVLASSFGLAAVVAIQAGVSAVLVLALGPASAGGARMIDVVIGTTVGLVFSQILLTPDPVRLIDAAARDLLERLALGFRLCLEALDRNDAIKAQAALRTFSAAHQSLIALDAGIASAQNAAKWSVRGRLAAREVGEIAARYDRRAVRLYASTLLFGEALANALRKGVTPIPRSLRERIADVESDCVRVAENTGLHSEDSRMDLDSATAGDVSPGWESCLQHLLAVEEALSGFQIVEASSRANGGKPFQKPSKRTIR